MTNTNKSIDNEKMKAFMERIREAIRKYKEKQIKAIEQE